MNVFTCNNVSIKRKDLTTCRTAKKKSFATLAFAKQILRDLSLETDAGSSHEDHCDPFADTHLHKSMLGNASVSFKMCQNKRILLGALGGGEVVWWLRQSSSSLLFRSFLGGDCVRGDLPSSTLFPFFLGMCVCCVVMILSDQLFPLPTETTSYNKQPPTQDWF